MERTLFNLAIAASMEPRTREIVENVGYVIDDVQPKVDHFHFKKRDNKGPRIQVASLRSEELSEFVNVGHIDIGNGDDRNELPEYLVQGYDACLVGTDWLKECELVVKEGGQELRFIELGKFQYGRETIGISLSLDLVVRENSQFVSVNQIPSGYVIATEFPKLTREFLSENGLKVRQTNLVDVSNLWTQILYAGLGYVLLVRAPGSIPQRVSLNNMLGVMVSESGKTLKESNLRVLAKIMDVEMHFIANINSFDDPYKKNEITNFFKRFQEGFRIALEKEATYNNKER